jgi:hypothetical protein
MNKKRKSSIITILLCFVLVFSLMTISASAASAAPKRPAVYPEIELIKQQESPNPSVFLRWTGAHWLGDKVELTGYRVYYKSSKDKEFRASEIIPAFSPPKYNIPVRSFTVSGLKLDNLVETYTFKVAALYGGGFYGTSNYCDIQYGKAKMIKIHSVLTHLSFRGNSKLTYAAASRGRLWLKWSPTTFDSAAKQSGYELTYQINNEKVQRITISNGNKTLSHKMNFPVSKQAQLYAYYKAGKQATIKVSVTPYAVNKYTGKVYRGPEVKKTIKHSFADF